jgi:hypothetical protein
MLQPFLFLLLPFPLCLSSQPCSEFSLNSLAWWLIRRAQFAHFGPVLSRTLLIIALDFALGLVQLRLRIWRVVVRPAAATIEPFKRGGESKRAKEGGRTTPEGKRRSSKNSLEKCCF